MQVAVKRTALLELLGKVRPHIPTRHNLPILSTVMLTADKGALTAMSCDFASFLTVPAKARVIKRGVVCVEPKGIEAFLKPLQVDTVTLSAHQKVYKDKKLSHYQDESGERRESYPFDGSNPVYKIVKRKAITVTVTAGNAVTEVTGHDPEAFPKPAKRPKGVGMIIPALGKAISQIEYAMAKDDYRPVLKGICITKGAKGCEVVATDGWRLAVTGLKIAGRLNEQVLIPRCAVRSLKRVLPEKIVMRLTDKFVFFTNGSAELAVQRVEGKYPSHNALIPKAFIGTLRFKVDDLKSALATVVSIKPDNDTVKLEARGGTLTLSGRNDGTVVKAKVKCRGKGRIAFNANYLKDLLSITAGDIALRLTAGTGPALLKQNGTIHMLMPMSVAW